MKVSREQAARNREAILEEAANMLRARGLEGTGVVDVMAAAGFSHGGFYGHFASKEDLLGQACRRIFQERAAVMNEALRNEPDPLKVVASEYLCRGHLENPQSGCPVPVLAGEVGRFPGPIRKAFSDGLKAVITGLASHLPGRSAKARRQKTLVALATLVGALSMARGTDDPELAEEILCAARASFGVGKSPE